MSDAIVKHIFWEPQNESVIGYRYPEKDIPTNSILKVGMGQVAVFVQYSEEGTAIRSFPEGRYQLETELPVGKKGGFFRRMFSKATGTNIYECDIYFFSVENEFINLKWLTRDGAVQCGDITYRYDTNDLTTERKVAVWIRGHGTFDVRLVFDEFEDPDTIKMAVKKLMGAKQYLTKSDVEDLVRDHIAENLSFAFGQVVANVGNDIMNLGK